VIRLFLEALASGRLFPERPFNTYRRSTSVPAIMS
jgi:hypothetical protein